MVKEKHMTQEDKVARIIVLAEKMKIKLGAERYCHNCRYKGSVVCEKCDDLKWWKGEKDE